MNNVTVWTNVTFNSN